MARISEVHLENVRCFRGRHSGKIKRITLLVGPNSAGKSTFLGCYKTFSELANLHTLDGEELGDGNHFNAAPFSMGSFDTIARSGESEFKLGGKFESHSHANANYKFTRSSNGDPQEQEASIEWDEREGSNSKLTVSRLTTTGSDPSDDMWRIDGPNFSFDVETGLSYKQFTTWLSRLVRRGYFPAVKESETENLTKFQNNVKEKLRLDESPWFNVQPLDPMPTFSRDRKHKTAPFHLPDGNSGMIEDIGKETHIWEGVNIEKRQDGTFEIDIETPFGTRNLIDVGYGAYSLLPLAISISKATDPTTFLLQQPEVHLHPQSQAGLAELMIKSKHEFMIETHSDHFLDRFVICVMEGRLKPEDFNVIYFHHENGETVLHNIGVDKNGNFINPPEEYRDFFQKEADRLLGFGESE